MLHQNYSYIGRTLAERYEVLDLLGKGSMGHVYSVWDAADQSKKAIKLVNIRKHKIPLEAQLQFKAECNNLKNLKHPSIISYNDFINEGDIYGLVMEFVPEPNLAEFVCKHGQLSIGDAFVLMTAISDALVFIHDRRLIHLDIKPSNILVFRDRNEKLQVKILDFGFSQLIGIPEGHAGGTVSYMAPEQTGILHKIIDHRSDLYSLGILMYEVLTGQVPFQDDDPAMVIYQHIARNPEKPSKIKEGIPQVLEDIILRLLKKDPADRYRTTNGLLNDLRKYNRLSREYGSPGIAFTLGDDDHWDSFPAVNPFIGRKQELEVFRELIENTTNVSYQTNFKNLILSNFFSSRPMFPEKDDSISSKLSTTGKGGFILLEGHKGIGKTTFLKYLYDELQQYQVLCWFHHLEKTEQDIPFKSIKHILENLNTHISKNYKSEQKNVISSIIKHSKSTQGIIEEFFPGLFNKIEAFDSSSSPQINRKFSVHDYSKTILGFLRRVTRIDNRLIIFIDDFQYLEYSSAKVLFELLNSIKNLPILFIFSYRFRQLPETHKRLIQKYTYSNSSQINHLRLAPLKEGDYGDLMQLLFSNKLYEIPLLLDPLYTATQGNPLLLRDLLQRAIDRRLIYFGNHTWKTQRSELLDFIKEYREKLGQDKPFINWPSSEKEVMKRAAMFLNPFNVHELQNLVKTVPEIDISDNKLFQILDKAVCSNILSINTQRHYSFCHFTDRYCLIDDLDEATRQILHRSIAEYLETFILRDSPESIYDIARHWDKAQDYHKATESYVKSAQLNDNGHFNDRQAEIFYNLALLSIKKAELNDFEAEMHFNVRYNAIKHTLHFSLEYDQIWEILKEIEPWIQSDKVRQMKFLSLKTYLCSVMGKIDEMFQCGLQLIKLGTEPNDEVYLIEIYLQMGTIASQKSYAERIEYLNLGTELAMRNEQYYLIIGALSIHVMLLSYQGKFKEAEAKIESFKQKFTDLNLPDLIILIENWPKMLLEKERGNFSNSLELGNPLEQFQQHYETPILALYQTNMAHCYGMTGDLSKALRLYDKLMYKDNPAVHQEMTLYIFYSRIEIALKMNNPEGALSFWEQSTSFFKSSLDQFTKARICIAAAHAHTELEQFDDAFAVMKTAADNMKDLDSPLLRCHYDYTINKLNWHQSNDSVYIKNVSDTLDKMKQLDIGGYYQIYLTDFENWSDHAPENPTISISDQKLDNTKLIKLFEISRIITTTHNVDELFQAALDGAMQITGANHGYLFTCSGQPEHAFEELATPKLAKDAKGRSLEKEQFLFSTSLLKSAYESKSIIVTRNAQKENKWDLSTSIHDLELRSVLIAPIVFNDIIKGFFYLDNRHAAAVFSLKDKEIVNIFATQVSIALNHAENFLERESISAENARLYDEIHQHNITLEQQVAKRTQELEHKTQQLQELNTNLESTVAKELDKRLHQEQLLVQQSKMAAMGEMIGMIAHQWRQPLSSISTVAGNMQVFIDLDMIDKQDFSGLLQTINKQVQYLSNTINDFRNFFSPQKNAESILLSEIIEKTLQLTRKSLENKGVKIEEAFVFTQPIVTFSNELMQVLLNILKNAQDAIVELQIPKPKITIQGKEISNFQEIKIIDNAGGIKEENLEKIFEPYYSTKDEKTGTGLGLYMSKIIIENHCGGVLTASNVKGGACFSIKLPI